MTGFILKAYRNLMFAGAVFSALVALFCLKLAGSDYTYILALPILYAAFLTVIGMVTWQTGPGPFLFICIPVGFLRYVAFPGLVAYIGEYKGRSWIDPSRSSYDLAIALMSYELICVGALVLFLEFRRVRALKRVGTPIYMVSDLRSLPLGYYVLLLSICFALATYLFPGSWTLVNFARPSIVEGDSPIAPADTFIAMTIVALVFMAFAKLALDLARNRQFSGIAPWIITLLASVNVLTYFGTNRMAVVLTSLATLWIIWRVLGSRAKLPILSILALGFLNFVTLTVERSYVQTSTEVPVIAADNIQGYVGGVYNVAIGTEVPTYFPESRDIRGLFYDFARPTIGLNLIVKDWERNYSNIYFNKRMFTHVDRRSQIIPMVSQSYIYLGFAFSPALTLLFIWLAYRLQYLIHEFRYIELQAVLILCTMRLGYIFGQNSMNMMNFLSLNLVIPFLIAGFYLAVKREHRLGQRRSLSMAMAAQSKKLLP